MRQFLILIFNGPFYK